MDYKVGDKIKIISVQGRESNQSKHLKTFLEDRDVIFTISEISPSGNMLRIDFTDRQFSINPKNWDIIDATYKLPEELWIIK